MEGRWTIDKRGPGAQERDHILGPETLGPTEVLPCDEAAIDRATTAAMEYDAETAYPDRDWYRGLVETAMRAAGEIG